MKFESHIENLGYRELYALGNILRFIANKGYIKKDGKAYSVMPGYLDITYIPKTDCFGIRYKDENDELAMIPLDVNEWYIQLTEDF